MFTDKRGKKIVILSHCHLNQNTKSDNCAIFPGAWSELINFFLKNGIGMLQLPCPELLLLGLSRGLSSGHGHSIAEDDTRIRQLMENSQFEKTMITYAKEIAMQIEEYQKHGFHVFGVIGVNGSPTCGIEFNWKDGLSAQGPGLFTEIIQKELKLRHIQVPMIGIKARESRESMKKVKHWIESIKNE